MNENHNPQKIVLVSRKIAFSFPLSFAYLAGYLKEKNEEVVVLFRDFRNQDLIIREILKNNPLIVGLGGLYPELNEIANLITELKRIRPQIQVVIGGQMVSPTPEFALEITGADYGVIGEGEIILHQLIIALRNQTEVANIKGIVFRKNNKIINNGPGDYIKDINQLPSIPFELFPEKEWLEIGRWYTLNSPQPAFWRFHDRVVNIHGGRGCPHRCNFCYHHSLPRYRSIDIMLKEAAIAIDRFDANMVYFSDDLVLATPNRAKELVDGIRKMKRSFNYSLSARFDVLNKIDDGLLQELKNTGCKIMGLGIESGSDKVLKEIGKKCTTDQIFHNIARLTKVGISPTVSIQVGQYNETREDAEKSVEMVRRTVQINPNIQYAFTITTPFPGSKLYDQLQEKGVIKSDRDFYNKYFFPHNHLKIGDWNQVSNLSQMTEKEILYYHQKLHKTYLEQKRQAFGPKLWIFEGIYLFFIKLNKFFEYIVFKKISPTHPLKSSYDKLRDKLFIELEMINLKIRKLKGYL